jgi:hypothetical protein
MPRGGARPNAGRPKGAVSRITPAKKAFLRAWIDETEPEMRAAWDMITSPVDKVRTWTALAEFAYPKLGRQELVGEDGGPIQVQIVKFSDKPEGP